MRRKVLVSFIVLMMSMLFIACGQKAEPMILPRTDEIRSVEVIDGTAATSYSDKEWISRFLVTATEAKATRKVSVQDQPQVEQYLKIELKCEGSISTLYFYEQRGAYYIEQPYQGIYRSDAVLYEMLTSNR